MCDWRHIGILLRIVTVRRLRPLRTHGRTVRSTAGDGDYEMSNMLGRLALLVVSYGALSSLAHAGDLDVGVTIRGEIVPGVYGRVDLGGRAPPPVVYAQPMIVEQAPPSVVVEPLYLHVPPEHAHEWRKHCHEYHACNRPVYFVRSREYAPEYIRRPEYERRREEEFARAREVDRAREYDRMHERDHEHGYDRDHDRRDHYDNHEHRDHDDRDHGRDHDHDHDHDR